MTFALKIFIPIAVFAIFGLLIYAVCQAKKNDEEVERLRNLDNDLKKPKF